MNLCQAIGHHMQQLTQLEGELEALRTQLGDAGREEVASISNQLREKESDAQKAQQEIEDLQYNVPVIFIRQTNLFSSRSEMNTPENRKKLFEIDEEGYIKSFNPPGYLLEGWTGDLRKCTRLKHVSIQQADGANLPKGMSTHPGLEGLDLRFMRGSLSLGAEASMPSLKRLCLKDTSIDREKWSWKPFPDLQTLELENVKSLPLEGIDQLKNLKTLVIREFPEGTDLSPLWELKGLTKLHLRNDHTTIDIKDIQKLSRLQDLTLDIPTKNRKELWRITSLAYLTILGDIGGPIDFQGIENLQQLRRLRLDRVKLKNPEQGIPGIGSLRALETLDLKSIEGLNRVDSLERLAQLTTLHLVNLGMGNLPDGIINHPSLQKVRIEKTEISEIPGRIGDPDRLTELAIEGPLESFPPDIGECHQLTRLVIHGTEIRDIPTTEIQKLTKLTYLSLWNTPGAREAAETIKQALPNCEISF